jgi:hypothetical protein
MSINTMLRNAIESTAPLMTNEYVAQNIIPELVEKFNKMPDVTDQNKYLINQFYQQMRTNKSTTPKESVNVMAGGSINVLQQAIAYYLSNINKYDGILVNYAVSYGLNMDKIIVLILINNIDDLKFFCRINNLNHEQTHTVIKLKKLSELYNLQHNF